MRHSYLYNSYIDMMVSSHLDDTLIYQMEVDISVLSTEGLFFLQRPIIFIFVLVTVDSSYLHLNGIYCDFGLCRILLCTK